MMDETGNLYAVGDSDLYMYTQSVKQLELPLLVIIIFLYDSEATGYYYACDTLHRKRG